MYTVSIEKSFSAAHFIQDYPGACARLHGHNYKLVITVEADKLDDLGMAIDFHELKNITNNVVEMLDHQNLNELDFFSHQNPTAENISRFVYFRLQEDLPAYIRLKEVTVVESEGCTVKYTE